MTGCIFVGLGGFVGASLRYLIGLLPFAGKADFPCATLLINLTGSVLIGFLAEIAGQSSFAGPHARLFLKTGVCGGFTTFSTFALETADLFTAGKTGVAVVYAFLSFALCVAGVFAGRLAARTLVR